MNELRIGDRVVLVSCAGAPGTIQAVRREKVVVCFDDLPGARWVLKMSSLERVVSVAP